MASRRCELWRVRPPGPHVSRSNDRSNQQPLQFGVRYSGLSQGGCAKLSRLWGGLLANQHRGGKDQVKARQNG
jgi:hypothetical protein